jgi:UDP-GlcNAc:undecaprenyl-phosphate GlcNAc-1-phosphate transferase
MSKYIFLFFISLFTSLIITPLIQLVAKKLNIFDFPSDRKIHKKPMPLLGGIPIFIAFNLAIFFGILFNFQYLKKFYTPKWKLILISQLIILGIGIFDDIKRVKPGIKLLFQIFAGSLLILFGFGIHVITNPFTGNPIHLGLLSIPITIIWLVGITNALNLVDGLDGLAAGTAFIACVTIFGVSYIYQNIGIALISLILAGSVLGFLRYNFHPAKIFLGDSGSLMLGFLLAFLSIEGSLKGATLAAVLAPILVLGFPIMDTLLSMIRRFLRPIIHLVDYPNENKEVRAIFFRGSSLFEADKDHIHHRLLKIGFSQRKAVIILYGICIILCGLAFITVIWKNINITLFLIAIIIASFIGIKTLKYREFKVLENGLLLPLFDIHLLTKRTFKAFIDLFFITVSYYFSFLLVSGGLGIQAKSLFIQTLSLVLVLKIIIFYLSGLYKGTWRYSSIDDLLKISKALILSSICSSLLLILIFGSKSFPGVILFILDFYLLFSLVAGSRFSYRVIDHYYHKKDINKSSKTIFELNNAIIYGAGRRGFLLAKEFQYNYNFDFNLLGYIDDDLNKKGKTLHNLPNLGTFKELEKIILANKISEIIISTKKIAKEKLEILVKLCTEKRITLQLFELKINKIV